MTIPRFYCPHDLTPDAETELTLQAAHHAARVLRLREGDAVNLFNGNGAEFAAQISQISKQRVVVTVLNKTVPLRESSLSVTLAQAISAGEKMDFTLQKAVELGISAIQPLSSTRSVVRLKDERAEKKLQHWQNVVIAACEQCGRNVVPTVAAISDLSTWLAGQGGETSRIGLILSPEAKHSLRELPKPQGPATLLIGPEGGLTGAEIKMAESYGFSAVRLGPRILRTETAALATLAAMQALWGDF
jgi:16S rRNA (uracil1498-N3)-methyltransferase